MSVSWGGLSYQLAAVFLTILVCFGLYAHILMLNGGVFTYALDDPYIHLAVAENILDGGYGINTGEFSAPSSSILYPYLLTVPMALGMPILGPLLIGVLASCGSAWLLSGLFWSSCIGEARSAVKIAAFVLLPVLLVVGNLYALPFLGMEHPLHVLVTLMVLVGVIRLTSDHLPALLIIGLILAPLLRFEGLAMTLAGLMIFVAYGRFGAAFVVGAVLAFGFGLHVSLMSSLGLPWLPSSVMVKSDSSAAVFAGDTTGALRGLITNVLQAFRLSMGMVVALGAALVLFALSIEGLTKKRLAVAFLALAVAGGHLVAGRFGWFGRYEVYTVVLLVAVAFHLFGPRVFPKEGNAAFGALGLAALLIVSGSDYLWRTAITSQAAHGIHGQHYQLHRFVTKFFPHPVAVNDIGYVSFQNDRYVLDLWGLGSEKARQARASGRFNSAMVEQLSDEADVRFAMVYENWLGANIPKTWCKVAEIENRARSAAEDQVALFLRDRSLAAEIQLALEAFGASLPEGTSIRYFPNCQ